MQQKDFQIKLGKRIASLRTERKYSQVQFAKMLGKEKQHFNKIETGKTNPGAWTLVGIAKLLEVPVGDLFN